MNPDRQQAFHATSLLMWVLLGLCVLISACGAGGGSGVSASATRLEGKFIDSAVEGLSYRTSSNVTGITRPDGGFDFNAGDRIEFSFGAIKFPSVLAKSIVTPLNMADGQVDSPVLNNIAYVLQALDADDNPENGITLSSNLASLATQALDFTIDTATFVKNPILTALISQKGGSKTTADSALNHIDWNLEQGFVDSAVIGPAVDCLFPDKGNSSADISLVKRVMSSSNRTPLASKMWADVYAKPQNVKGWFYDSTYTLRTPNAVGSFEPYRPTASSPEIQAAKVSQLWHSYSQTYDAWFKHRDQPNVMLRVAALKTYGGLVNQPDYIGNAIFLHYTGDLNSYLELLFKPKLSSAIFFNFTSNNKSILFNSTLGKDGQLGGDVDGYLPPGLTQWAAQHVPGDVNFPPNLRQGATTSAGRQIPDGTCLIAAGGSALLWLRPSSRSDFFFSPVGVSVPGKGTAPLYNDAQGYQGSVGVFSNENAIELTIIKP